MKKSKDKPPTPTQAKDPKFWRKRAKKIESEVLKRIRPQFLNQPRVKQLIEEYAKGDLAVLLRASEDQMSRLSTENYRLQEELAHAGSKSEATVEQIRHLQWTLDIRNETIKALDEKVERLTKHNAQQVKQLTERADYFRDANVDLWEKNQEMAGVIQALQTSLVMVSRDRAAFLKNFLRERRESEDLKKQQHIDPEGDNE